MCGWLISLRIMYSTFICMGPYISISLIFKAEWYSILCIYHFLLIHSSINGHLGCFYFVAIVNNATVNIVHKYLFKTLLLILLSVNPLVELLDLMVILFLTLWGTTLLFSTVTAPLYIPMNSAQVFQFFHVLTIAYYFLVLYICHPNEYELVSHSSFYLLCPND